MFMGLENRRETRDSVHTRHTHTHKKYVWRS